MRTGAEVFIERLNDAYEEENDIVGIRMGVVANQTSMVGNTHLVDTLLALGADIRKIFCPEHGFRGTAEAGVKVDNSVDAKTGLPIISLYGKNKKPTAE